MYIFCTLVQLLRTLANEENSWLGSWACVVVRTVTPCARLVPAEKQTVETEVMIMNRLAILLVAFLASFGVGCTGSGAGAGHQPPPGGGPSSPPPVTDRGAVRFLEQSTFGPTTALIAQVKQSGYSEFVNAQFNAPLSTYPEPGPQDQDLSLLQQRFFSNALTGQDQLRQRTAFALGQIWVISGNTIDDPQAFTPFLRILLNDAFGNYFDLMRDVTLSPAMGTYLNMVDNDKPDPQNGIHANENYAREFLQLFTIGTFRLNLDGTLQRNAQGQPIPSYDQNVIKGFARAFTGWTYPTMPGQLMETHNPPYFNGPMEADDSNHDTDPKALLNGFVLPGGQTAAADLDGALRNIFNHPNIGPFISRQLIQHLVTSNPSPSYVRRVASAFNDNGSGVRGDLKAVVKTILLDPEARRGDDPATTEGSDGHLREPILLITSVLRSLNTTSDGASLAEYGAIMGQNALYPPSVFNFFSPNFQIPGTQLLGPEFQIFTTLNSLNRANFINSFVFDSLDIGTRVDFSALASLANDSNRLLDELDKLLLHGTMSSQMRQTLRTAIEVVPSSDLVLRAKTAVYLITTSSQYQVQR